MTLLHTATYKTIKWQEFLCKSDKPYQSHHHQGVCHPMWKAPQTHHLQPPILQDGVALVTIYEYKHLKKKHLEYTSKTPAEYITFIEKNKNGTCSST